MRLAPLAICLLLVPFAAAQVPDLPTLEQPRVTLAEDGAWIHFGSAMPLDVQVGYSINGGAAQTAAAVQLGVVRANSAVELGTFVYAAKVPAGPGDVIVYRGITPLWETGPATVTMPPADTLRWVAYGDIGYEGVAADGSDDGMIAGGAPPIRIRDLALAQQPELLVIPGDLSYDNSRVGWDRFMRMMAPIQSTIPTMAVAGNHEWDDAYGYGQFLASYALPGDSHDFAFQAGPITFVGLNSDTICAGDTYRTSYGHEAEPCPVGEPDLEKLARVEALLSQAQNDTTPWTVAFMHHPPFSWGRHNSDFGVRTLWSPLFDKYGVDFVVTAHDHLYSRSYPVLADETTTQDGDTYVAGDGIVYIVLGGGGRPLYEVRYPDQEPPSWFANGGVFYHLMAVEADNETLAVTVLGLDGETMDSFRIVKGSVSEAVEEASMPWPGILVLLALAALARRPRP